MLVDISHQHNAAYTVIAAHEIRNVPLVPLPSFATLLQLCDVALWECCTAPVSTLCMCVLPVFYLSSYRVQESSNPQ